MMVEVGEKKMAVGCETTAKQNQRRNSDWLCAIFLTLNLQHLPRALPASGFTPSANGCCIEK